MARPKLPVSELHDQEFRVRLNQVDADLVRALARKLGLAPAELLRVYARKGIQGHVSQSVGSVGTVAVDSRR